MGIENILIFCVLLLSVGEGVMVLTILKDIENDLKTISLINDKTNERLDRLIDTAMFSINEIRKNIQNINKKLD